VAELDGRVGTVNDVQAVTRKLLEELQQNYNFTLNEDPISFLSKLEFNPVEQLTKDKLGCIEQCPFCGVSCDNGYGCDGKNRKHSTERHRPQGFAAYHWSDSKKLVFDICSSLVSGEYRYKGARGDLGYRSYSNVKEHLTDWTIRPEPDTSAQAYWQYLFAKHHVKIAELKKVKPADIPEGWKTVSEADALTSLKIMLHYE